MTKEQTRETDLIIYAALKSIAGAFKLLERSVLSIAAVYERRYGLGKAHDIAPVVNETYTVAMTKESEAK